MRTSLLVFASLLAACGGPSPGPDASLDAEADDASLDAAAPPCLERNTPEEVAARDGFVEVCASAEHPRAVCGDGSPYRFSYRPAEGPSAGLLVYFRGGGNCTDYVSCWGTDGMGGTGRRVSTLENERTSPEVLPGLGRTFGFFDRVDPTALFADFDVVYASYCSGDAGLTSTEDTLTRPPEASPDAPAEIVTYFRGIDNRRAVIAAALERFPAPVRLVIAGSSAGSYAALGAVPELVEAYDAVRDVAYFGEGGIGVGRPSYSALFADTLAAHDGAEGRPLVRFLQFSFDLDATQQDYAPAPFPTDDAAFRAELLRLTLEREAAHPGHYRSFVAAGTCHTVANNPALYQAFARTAGRWAPVMPAQRPNPALVEGGVSLVDTLRTFTRGAGPLAFASVRPASVGTDCALPGS